MGKFVTLRVQKPYVFDEVKKASEYMGQKLVTEQDPGAYARVSATDADEVALERFWQEGCGLATQALQRYMVAEGEAPGKGGVRSLSRDYVVTLSLPDGFDEGLSRSLERSLSSYIVTSMLAKWCLLANRADAQAYMDLSGVALQDINRKLYKRNRPSRP